MSGAKKSIATTSLNGKAGSFDPAFFSSSLYECYQGITMSNSWLP
jgi:hypothetical protein